MSDHVTVRSLLNNSLVTLSWAQQNLDWCSDSGRTQSVLYAGARIRGGITHNLLHIMARLWCDLFFSCIKTFDGFEAGAAISPWVINHLWKYQLSACSPGVRPVLVPVVCWGAAPGPRPPWRGCSSGTWPPPCRPAAGSRWRGVGPPSWQLSCRRRQTCPQSASTWWSDRARRALETSQWCPILAGEGPAHTDYTQNRFFY